MKIEVNAKTVYTVELSDEDVSKVKSYMESHKEELPSFNMEENFCWAVQSLFANCEIDLYADGKATESDFITEEIRWSEFEDSSVEEILLK